MTDGSTGRVTVLVCVDARSVLTVSWNLKNKDNELKDSDPVKRHFVFLMETVFSYSF